MAFVQDAVSVRRHPLLRRRVKVVGAGVVLVGRDELDGVLDVAVENEALVLEVVELVELEDGDAVLDFPDDNFPGLFDPEVEVSAPECAVKVVGKVPVSFPDGQRSGQVQHGVDLAQVLDAIADIFLNFFSNFQKLDKWFSGKVQLLRKRDTSKCHTPSYSSRCSYNPCDCATSSMNSV